MTAYATMRQKPLDRGGLSAMTNHALRQDRTSETRVIEKNAPPWTKLGSKLKTSGLNLDHLDYSKLADEHLKITGAKLSGKAQSHWRHFVVPMAKDFEPDEKLFEAYAIEFENWATERGIDVLAFRVDRDEKGKHTLDIFTAPMNTTKTGKLEVSPTAWEYRLLKELGIERNDGRALGVKGRATHAQDSFAEFMIEHLAPKLGTQLHRGKRKEASGNDWKTPEQISAEKELEASQVALKRDQVRLRASESAFEREKAQSLAEIEKIRSEALKIAQETEKTREKKLTLFNKTEIIQDELEKQERITKMLGDERDEVQKLKSELKEEIQEAEKHRQYERSLRNREVKAINEYPQVLGENEVLKKQIEELKTTKTPEHQKLEADVQSLKSELQETKTNLQAIKSVFELLKSKFKSLFPSHYEEVAKVVNPEWEVHPHNPNKKPDEPTNSSRSFSR